LCSHHNRLIPEGPCGVVVKNLIRTVSNLWRGTPERWGDSYFYPLQPGTWADFHYLDAFNTIPELNAIINLLARCHSNGIYKIVDKNGKDLEGHKHAGLIQNPNWFQDQKEFIRATVLFHEIYGNEYLYLLFPFGFNPDRTKALFTLPPNLICPELDETQPFYTFSKQPKVKYILDYEGRKVEIHPETIIHLNDNQVNITKINQKDILKGTSKMMALTPALNNIKMAYESRGIIIKYRGAQGILSPDGKDAAGTIPFSEPEKEAAQLAWRGYGTLQGQAQLLITSVAAKFTPMTQNEPKKLGLFDECKEDFNKMLDSYQVPPDLFVGSQGATWENKNQARKDIYENNIIPSANERVAAINQKLFADDSAKLIVDFSNLPIFQEDLKVKSEARTAAVNYLSRLLQDKQITTQEYREELHKIGIGSGKPIPVEMGDANQQEVETRQAQATLRGSVGGVQGVLSIQASVVAGTTTRESAMSMLTIIFGFTEEQAGHILGNPESSTETTQPNEQE
jgi:hypothetical protein